MGKISFENLKQRQSLPLEAKISLSNFRIREWYEHFNGDVYVSFSGGKDSTVLLDIVRNTPGVYDVPAVFVDTGLEYPEVRSHATRLADVVLRPDMSFKSVLEKYGYPVVSKEQSQYIRDIRNTNSEKMRQLRLNGNANGSFKISDKWRYLLDAPFEISEQCCSVMKKRPVRKYEKESGRKPYIGVMADESTLRRQGYLDHGCNSFDASRKTSSPLGFWTEQDILEYIVTSKLEIPSVYGDIVGCEHHRKLTGVTRTGCMFCMFGAHLEKCPNRFQRMRITHPKQYDYCINTLGLGAVLDYIHVPYGEYDEQLELSFD